MNYATLPAPVLAKLLALEQVVEHLRSEKASIASEIENKRLRLNGRIIDQRDDASNLEQDLRDLTAEHTQARVYLDVAQRVVASCKTWLEGAFLQASSWKR